MIWILGTYYEKETFAQVKDIVREMGERKILINAMAPDSDYMFFAYFLTFSFILLSGYFLLVADKSEKNNRKTFIFSKILQIANILLLIFGIFVFMDSFHYPVEKSKIYDVNMPKSEQKTTDMTF